MQILEQKKQSNKRDRIPTPSSGDARRRMEKQSQRDTKPETQIRSILHSNGLRYRVDFRPLKSVRRKADIAFIGPRVAVFIDGCFWHGCPIHGTWPKANAEFWRDKIISNQKRDADTNIRFERAGWKVIRIWEHEEPGEAAKKITKAVESRRTI